MILGVQTGVTNFRKIGSGELILSTMKSFLSENEKGCSFTGITPMHAGQGANWKFRGRGPGPGQKGVDQIDYYFFGGQNLGF